MVGGEDRHEQLGTRLVILERKMQPARFESGLSRRRRNVQGPSKTQRIAAVAG